MIRKLLCKLGFHDWYRIFPFGSKSWKGYHVSYECKYCNKISKEEIRKEPPTLKEMWWLNTSD